MLRLELKDNTKLLKTNIMEEKILGLDLGTNSIGWAIIDKKNQNIIDAGVRIFQEGVKKDTIGKGDKEESKNSERRQHRQARRLNFRKRIRKAHLLKLLIDHKMVPLSYDELNNWRYWSEDLKTSGKIFPSGDVFVGWLKQNPYQLRHKALREDITLYEFGRILYHFIQRRGFLSSRKGKAKDSGVIFKGKDNMAGVENAREMLENRTLGQMLFELHPIENESFYIRKDINDKEIRIRARYTLREMYVEEFEKIWQRQSKPLNLEEKMIAVKRKVYLKGSFEQKRNKRKLLHLIELYGNENIKQGDKFIEITKIKNLKEHLAGHISHTDEGIRFKSNESVLFWQRPLRSQKSSIGKCNFEKRKVYDGKLNKFITTGKSPAYVSHPDFELFRAHQFINNIKIGKNGQLLNINQREVVLGIINSKDKAFDFRLIKKALNLSHEIFNYDDDFKVSGNKTHATIASAFPVKQWEKQKESIWHAMIFFEDSELLSANLVTKFGLEKTKADKLSRTELDEGYSSISLKAIRNILPFLQKGYRYSTSVVLGGLKNAFGERWVRFDFAVDEIIKDVVHLVEDNKHKEYELINEVKKYLSDEKNQLGFTVDDPAFKKLYHPTQEIEKREIRSRLSEIENLRNPIVQKALYEMRRLINLLMEKYEQQFGQGFMFDRIQVEFGRDIKNTKKRRQEMTFKIRENEIKNAEAREKLLEFGMRPSRENITKFLLFQEIIAKNGTMQCPYTGKTITINDVLGEKNLYQIEHIVPLSVSLDDSFANKTLCESNFNRVKGELTPYEFYQKNNSNLLWNADSWEEIEQRAYRLLPYIKAKRFTSVKRLGVDEFIQRQLNDTRYISKKAAELLGEICEDVRVLPGQLTAELRKLWGLNHLLRDPSLTTKDLPVPNDDGLKYWAVISEEGKVRELIPAQNNKPQSEAQIICINGEVDANGRFTEDTKHRHLRFELIKKGIGEGKYWLSLKLHKEVEFTKIFIDKPVVSPDYISLKGQIVKGKFTNDTIKKNLAIDAEEGSYWAIFKINKSNFLLAERNEKPDPGAKEILLFGKVKDGRFSSYIYESSTTLPDGRYWVIIELDFELVQYVKARQIPVSKASNELLIEGTINDQGIFTADHDPDYEVKTNNEAGKYFGHFTIENIIDFYPKHLAKPLAGKKETVVESLIWVDKQTGEIQIDIQKNREDQRHHAIDAIIVALSEQTYLNQLSRYNDQLKDWERGLIDRPKFDKPWPKFERITENAISQILVSYAQNRKVVSKISKMIEKQGVSYRSSGIAARGKLHREFYFGTHPLPLIHAKNPQNGELLFEKDKSGNKIYYYHIRKQVTSLQNHKHIAKIVDEGIKKLITDRLEKEFNIDTGKDYKIPADFFIGKDKNPALFLPNKNGHPVPIKKVRLRETIGNAKQIKSNVNQWVNPYNNHHVVIYRDNDDTIKEQVVSLWEVVERMQNGQKIYQMPDGGKKLITTLQENEMFLMGLPEDLTNSLNHQTYNNSLLSPYLFRVQKISSLDYTFRHHLVSSVSSSQGELRIASFKAWEELNPIKVKVNQIGNLDIEKI